LICTVGNASALTVAGIPPTGVVSALAFRETEADVVASAPSARTAAAVSALPRIDTREKG
jgi:hypothetical protein